MTEPQAGSDPGEFSCMAEQEDVIETEPAIPDFDEIVEKYSDFVYNVAFKMMSNPEDAEDVAQEAFISAYRAFGRFLGNIFAIGVNLMSPEYSC